SAGAVDLDAEEAALLDEFELVEVRAALELHHGVLDGLLQLRLLLHDGGSTARDHGSSHRGGDLEELATAKGTGHGKISCRLAATRSPRRGARHAHVTLRSEDSASRLIENGVQLNW